MSALDKQVAGDHYKTLGMQPLEHTYLNYGYQGLKAAIHTKVDKYLLRRKDNEVEQIEKAIHCLEVLRDKALIEQEVGEAVRFAESLELETEEQEADRLGA